MSKQNKDELLKIWKSEIEGIIPEYSFEYIDTCNFTESGLKRLSSAIVDYIQELFDDPDIVEAMTSKIFKPDVNSEPEPGSSQNQ
jgi:hypothetical protein